MQGQSAYTHFKYQRFGPVLAQSVLISKAPQIAHFAYYHVDLNAGSGMNSDIVDAPPVPGSPLNFLGAVSRHRRDFYAFFVDQDLPCIRALITRPEVVAQTDRIAIFHSDNSHVLPVVAEFVAQREPNPHYAVGSILVDPNGYHKGVPWDALRVFCAAHPRFDVFVNLNVRTFQLERPWIIKGEGLWAAHRLHRLSEFPEWFSRPNWMVTEVCSLGGSRWVQLVGRTMKTQTTGYSSLGFYDVQSIRGQRIIEAIETPAARTSTEFPLLSEL
jgi:three-Cys-motif partner protein